MKRLMRLLGFVRLKDVNDYLDREAEYWMEKRKGLTDPSEILHENYSYMFANYSEAAKNIKVDINNNL